MTETIIGYKFIREDRTSKNGDSGKWVKGRWKKHEGELELCASGFHACLTPKQATKYIYGGLLCVVEAKGKILHEKNDKFVAEQMRVVEVFDAKPIMVEWAIACAWRVLKVYEKV